MFGIGMSEMIIICVVALLVFGPDELPQIVKKVARGIGEARKVTDDLRRSIDLVDDEEEDRRARAFARSQQALQGVQGSAERVNEPEVIPGSALTPTHGEDASAMAPPLIAAATGAVPFGAADADADADVDAVDAAGAAGAAGVAGSGAVARADDVVDVPASSQSASSDAGAHGIDAVAAPSTAGR
jgi:sec-independent protein translocase protein TatB